MEIQLLFIGGGNMAEGIIRGIIKNNVVSRKNIFVKEVKKTRREYLEKSYGISVSETYDFSTKKFDIIILVVTPNIIPTVIQDIYKMVSKSTVIVSIAAGVPLNYLNEKLPRETKVIRVMPNTLSQSGIGYSAACMNEYCLEEDKSLVICLLEALGKAMFIDESMFDSFTTLGTTGPLWVYKTIEALINSGVYIGINREDARNIVLENMIGAARELEITGENPSLKIEKMTSPGGITIKALKTLEEEKFNAAIMKSIDVCFSALKK